jgi:hypothetical protein
MKIKVTKISDCENPEHPDHIPPNYVRVGTLVEAPEVGKPFWLGFDWRTSPVTKVVDKRTFETMNSIYKWEEIG